MAARGNGHKANVFRQFAKTEGTMSKLKWIAALVLVPLFA